MNKLVYLFLFYFLATFPLIAQRNGRAWIWPEDRVKAEEFNALYTDYLSLKDYRQSANHLIWLLTNAPELNLSIYQNGSKIYENLAINETVEVHKQVFVDSMLLMYDLRMHYFGDSVNVMNRKVNKAYKHLRSSNDHLPFLLNQFDITFRISGNDVLNSNLPAYMDVVKQNKLVLNNLTTEEVFERYDKISMIVDYKMNIGQNLKAQKDLIDRLLTEAIPEGIDCNFVRGRMGGEYYANPSVDQAKKIFGFMWRAGCTDDALFFNVSKMIHENEPTYTIGYKIIGKRCLANEDIDCAIAYFKEAIQLAKTDEEKIDVILDLAKLYARQEDNVSSRGYFLQALEIDTGNKNAWNGIGNLYFYGAKECSKLQSRVYDRLIYIAAYEKYKKAGNTKMMESSLRQFPSRQDIFLDEKLEGEPMRLRCWVNETVYLKARPSS